MEQQLVVEPSLSLEPLAVHPNALLIKSLYSAIGAQDLTAIDACYDDEAYFQDIAFRRHRKRRIMEMWRYVCHGKPDVTFDVNTISADDRTGTGRWRAKYVFGKTDRKPGVRIDNAITSAFVFRNGLIVEHRDDCDVMGWARQAFRSPIAVFIVGHVAPFRRGMAGLKLYRFRKKQKTD